MILNLLELYEKYDYLFALLLSLFMWAFGYLSKRFATQIKKIRVARVLRLKNDDVEILIPDRNGKLTLSSTSGATELTDSFVTKGEMEAALELKEEINNLGLSATILSHPTKDKENNIFCIDNLSTLKDDDIVIIRAHGETKENYSKIDNIRNFVKNLYFILIQICST